MKRSLLALCVLLGAAATSESQPRCWLGMTECVTIQGSRIPLDVAESMADDCANFTRGHVGARMLQLSVSQVLALSERYGRLNPVVRAFFAYDRLHDSPLAFDRSIPYPKRYRTVYRACGQVFRDLRVAPPPEAAE